MPVCESVDTSAANWATYDKILTTIEAPVKFMNVVDHDIIANGQAVTKDLGLTLNALRSGDFYTSGLDLGNVLTQVVDTEVFLY